MSHSSTAAVRIKPIQYNASQNIPTVTAVLTAGSGLVKVALPVDSPEVKRHSHAALQLTMEQDLNPPRGEYPSSVQPKGEAEKVLAVIDEAAELCKVKQRLPTLLDVMKEIERRRFEVKRMKRWSSLLPVGDDCFPSDHQQMTARQRLDSSRCADRM